MRWPMTYSRFIIFQSAVYHAWNYFRRFLYIQTGWPWIVPKPYTVYLIPNLTCNSRCTICNSWKLRSSSIPFSRWKRCIDDIATTINPFVKLNILGGEILVSPVSLKLIQYAVRQLPYTGITSNGFLITQKIAKTLIASGYTNINISLDGVTQATVQKLRGRSDAYEKASQAILFLLKEKRLQHASTKIIIKSVISGINFHELPLLTQWAQDISADGIYLQPVQPVFFSDQTHEQLQHSPLWIRENQKKQAKKVFDTLIALKDKGYPVLNSKEELYDLYPYFSLTQKQASFPSIQRCFIDIDSLFILNNGNVHFCMDFKAVGNITRNRLSDILRSKEACSQRQHIRTCQKHCLLTCSSKKSLRQLIYLFIHTVWR